MWWEKMIKAQIKKERKEQVTFPGSTGYTKV